MEDVINGLKGANGYYYSGTGKTLYIDDKKYVIDECTTEELRELEEYYYVRLLCPNCRSRLLDLSKTYLNYTVYDKGSIRCSEKGCPYQFGEQTSWREEGLR